MNLIVTDHALLRYIERKYKLSLEPLRQELHSAALPFAAVGAAIGAIDDIKFILRRNKRNADVTLCTILGRDMHRPRGLIERTRDAI